MIDTAVPKNSRFSCRHFLLRTRTWDNIFELGKVFIQTQDAEKQRFKVISMFL